MHDEMQLKMVFNGLVIGISWLLTYLELNPEIIMLYGVLLVIDFFTGMAKSSVIGHPITSIRMRHGILVKFGLLMIPLVMAIVIKITSFDYHFVVSWGMTVLALSEAYSIIGNIYTMKTKESLPEYEVIAVIAKKLRHLLVKLEGEDNDKKCPK